MRNMITKMETSTAWDWLDAPRSIVIVLGGQATGKTQNRESLMAHYKCDYCFDACDFSRGDAIACGGKDVLILSNLGMAEALRTTFLDCVGEIRVSIVTVEAARKDMGGKWIGSGQG